MCKEAVCGWLKVIYTLWFLLHDHGPELSRFIRRSRKYVYSEVVFIGHFVIKVDWNWEPLHIRGWYTVKEEHQNWLSPNQKAGVSRTSLSSLHPAIFSCLSQSWNVFPISYVVIPHKMPFWQSSTSCCFLSLSRWIPYNVSIHFSPIMEFLWKRLFGQIAFWPFMKSSLQKKKKKKKKEGEILETCD